MKFNANKKASLPISVLTAGILAVGGICFGVQQGSSQINYPLSGPPGPTIVGPGLAPNIGVSTNPDNLSYYGGYYGYTSNANTFPTANKYGYNFGQEDIPQTTSKLSVKLISKTQLSFQWDGQSSAINRIKISIYDKAGNILTTKSITSNPTKTTLKKPALAASYTVQVQYINGQTSAFSSPF